MATELANGAWTLIFAAAHCYHGRCRSSQKGKCRDAAGTKNLGFEVAMLTGDN
jgi:hypothetical protein